MTEIDASKPSDDLKLIIEQWKTVISVQMHFNDMIAKIRQVAATVGFGGTAYIITKSSDNFEIAFSIYKIEFTNKSILFIALLIFIFSILLVDRFYYFKMLISSVDLAKAQEEKFKLPIKMTTYISSQTTPRDAMLPVYFLYGCLILFNFIFLFSSLHIK